MRSANVFRRNMQSPREQLAGVDRKFHPGPTPLEREPFEDVIKPQYREQLMQMMKLMDQYAQNGDENTKRAVALWQAQVAQGTFSDRVKFEFCRRFYYWLLGRGTDDDHERTLWGRGNAAVYNPQVRAYIESFGSKRLQYAQQLALLANRVPETLNGYYLYYKVSTLRREFDCTLTRPQYIVGGALKRVTKGGQAYWDMSDEDYLSDFEMFHNEFDPERDFIAKPFDKGGRPGEEPFPNTPAEKRQYAVRSFSNQPGADPQITKAATNQFVMQGVDRSQSATVVEEAESATDAPAMEAVSGGPSYREHHLSLANKYTQLAAKQEPGTVERRKNMQAAAEHARRVQADIDREEAARRATPAVKRNLGREMEAVVDNRVRFATMNEELAAAATPESVEPVRKEVAEKYRMRASELEAQAEVAPPAEKARLLAKAEDTRDGAAMVAKGIPLGPSGTPIVNPSPQHVAEAEVRAEVAKQEFDQAEELRDLGLDEEADRIEAHAVGLLETPAGAPPSTVTPPTVQNAQMDPGTPVETTPVEPVSQEILQLDRDIDSARREYLQALERKAPKEQLDAWQKAIRELEFKRAGYKEDPTKL